MTRLLPATLGAAAMTIIATAILSGAPAGAQNLLTNGDFEACTVSNTFQNSNLDGDTGPFNEWLDRARWVCANSPTPTGTDGQYALHVPQDGGNTDLLFQGVEVTDELCLLSGTQLQLSFDYINQNADAQSSRPRVQVYGFGPDGQWNFAAPFGPQGTFTELLNQQLNRPQDPWTTNPTSFSIDINDDFSSIGVGFQFGFGGGTVAANVDDVQGVDNVVLEIVAIPAEVDIDPDTLNPKSKGNFITAYIMVADCFDPENINPASVELTMVGGNSIPPLPAVQWDVQDGVLMVKFSRQDLIAELESLDLSGTVALKVEGELDGISFSAEDDINVLDK